MQEMQEFLDCLVKVFNTSRYDSENFEKFIQSCNRLSYVEQETRFQALTRPDNSRLKTISVTSPVHLPDGKEST